MKSIMRTLGVIITTSVSIYTCECAEPPEESPEEINDFPEGGIQAQFECLISALRSISTAVTGSDLVPASFMSQPLQEEALIELKQQLSALIKTSPLRFENTDNPFIVMKDRFRHADHYFEVTREDENGGAATYIDKLGRPYNIKWNNQRIVNFDSNPQQLFSGETVPSIIDEPTKPLQEAIGLTSTIIRRTPNGGVVRLPGTISACLVELHKVLGEIQAGLPSVKKFNDFGEISHAGFTRVTNQLDRMESEIKDIHAECVRLELRNNQMLVLLCELAEAHPSIISRYSMIMDPDICIHVPQHWLSEECKSGPQGPQGTPCPRVHVHGPGCPKPSPWGPLWESTCRVKPGPVGHHLCKHKPKSDAEAPTDADGADGASSDHQGSTNSSGNSHKPGRPTHPGAPGGANQSKCKTPGAPKPGGPRQSPHKCANRPPHPSCSSSQYHPGVYRQLFPDDHALDSMRFPHWPSPYCVSHHVSSGHCSPYGSTSHRSPAPDRPHHHHRERSASSGDADS
ncbi:MAG: hypothetical protein LBR89_01970 [Holosporales bacterium]|nr:hypothetical protein [Holosporales bacterium]